MTASGASSSLPRVRATVRLSFALQTSTNDRICLAVAKNSANLALAQVKRKSVSETSPDGANGIIIRRPAELSSGTTDATDPLQWIEPTARERLVMLLLTDRDLIGLCVAVALALPAIAQQSPAPSAPSEIVSCDAFKKNDEGEVGSEKDTTVRVVRSRTNQGWDTGG